jgi:hypothetical protein
MPDSTTTHRAYTKPEDGASEDTWGVKLNDDFDNIDNDIYALLTTANYGANTGTADALVVTLSPVLQSLSEGQRVFVKVSADNTTALTLAVDSTGVKDVVNQDGSTIIAGQLQGGGIYGFAYDGAQYRLMDTPIATMAELLAGTDTYKRATAKALADLNSTSGTTYVLKLPGGYMIQAGAYTGGSNNPTIDFDVAFSEAPRVTLTAYSTNNNTNSSSNSVRKADLASVTAANFTAWCASEDQVSDVFVGNTGVSFDWVAVGKV